MKLATARTRAAGVTSALAAALVLATASASAPTDQYQTFNRDDSAITDEQTHLIWQRAVVLKASDQGEALAYCQNTYKGDPVSQWRLPTMKELLTIVDETPHFEFELGINQPKMLDVNAFPRSPTDVEYWSSSVVAGSSNSQGWVVKFRSGENAQQSVGLAGYVRCVRDQ
jgi:Protein of unknown function (DUF1566)